MSEHNELNQPAKAVPDLKKNKALKAAFLQLAPMIEEAKKRIAKLPLRPITDPVTCEQIMQRFATAEELQRIVMETCKGRIIINTVPVRLGSHPAVVAQIAILTSDGYVVLPGSHASQKSGEGSIELGNRQLLSAETRSIRRSLRELGLRAEYEEYDVEDRVATTQAEPVDKKPGKVAPDKVVKPTTEDDQDSDIPSVPEGVFDVAPSVNDTAKTEKTPRRRPSTKSAGKAKVVEKAAEISIPAQPLEINVDVEHSDWPARSDMRYQDTLINALTRVKQQGDMTVEVMAKRVFGQEHEAFKRLASYTTHEMEIMYQFYVIQQGVS